jgi:hypothetical protein
LFTGCHPRQPPDADAPDEGTHHPAAIDLLVFAPGPSGAGNGDASSTAAARAAIHDIAPDVLAVLDAGSPDAIVALRADLRRLGIDYTDSEYIAGASAGGGLGVLSRLPIVARHSQTNLTYRMGDQELPLQNGILDVTIVAADRYPLRLILVALKDKTFHRYGQTEMRRNESRLVARHVRRVFAVSPHEDLIVVGSLNDVPGSAAVRDLIEEGDVRLHDLRPVDEFGDAWTVFDPEQDAYLRHDYVLASPSLLPAVERARILNLHAGPPASPRRPILLRLRADRTANHVPSPQARWRPRSPDAEPNEPAPPRRIGAAPCASPRIGQPQVLGSRRIEASEPAPAPIESRTGSLSQTSSDRPRSTNWTRTV